MPQCAKLIPFGSLLSELLIDLTFKNVTTLPPQYLDKGYPEMIPTQIQNKLRPKDQVRVGKHLLSIVIYEQIKGVINIIKIVWCMPYRMASLKEWLNL